jgi:hypothetical protein
MTKMPSKNTKKIQIIRKRSHGFSPQKYKKSPNNASGEVLSSLGIFLGDFCII